MNNPAPDVSIVLPAFNEEEALRSDLPRLLAAMDKSSLSYEILLVNDGSTDNTAEVARQFPIRVIDLDSNRGVGFARKTGIRMARGKIIAMSDVDGTYPLDLVPDMVRRLGDNHMVIGARDQETGTLKPLRMFTKYIILQAVNRITNQRIPDLNSGFRAFKRDTALKFFNILPDSHSFVSTITICFLANEYPVAFFPIPYRKRIGKSTFGIFRDTKNYILLLFRTIFYFSPLKFLLPLSFFVFLLGAARLVYHAFFTLPTHVKESDIMIVLAGLLIGVVAILADLIVKEHKSKYIYKGDN